MWIPPDGKNWGWEINPGLNQPAILFFVCFSFFQKEGHKTNDGRLRDIFSLTDITHLDDHIRPVDKEELQDGGESLIRREGRECVYESETIVERVSNFNIFDLLNKPRRPKLSG